jgi:hypothetical protein
MSIVAHTRTFVIGVDAHARTHALAILACPTGELLDERASSLRPPPGSSARSPGSRAAQAAISMHSG